MTNLLLRIWTFVLFWTVAYAHGGKSLGEELQARQVFARDNQMDLRHCADKFERDGLYDRAFERRAQMWNDLKKKSQVPDGSSKDRQARHGVFDFSTHDFNILSTRKHGCVLHPELTEGPYYVEGEKVRSDLVDGQDGVLLLLDFQIVDSETCSPVEGVYVEIWFTNATGVYSGIVAGGNGSGKDDAGNAYTAFNRGAQETAKDGVVFFQSIFPGHYAGRAPHVHVMTHIDPEIAHDGAILGTRATHVGQLFFDQMLILDVEKQPAYSTNKKELTLNGDDYYFREALRTSDPIMPWMGLQWPGYDHAILSWMPIGVNMSYVREVSVAATLKPKPTDG